MTKVGTAIREVRRLKNIPQKDLAIKADISQTQLSLIESNKSNGSMKTIETLCRVLDTPIAVIMWMALSVDDVQDTKKAHFEVAKPIIDKLLIDLITNE